MPTEQELTSLIGRVSRLPYRVRERYPLRAIQRMHSSMFSPNRIFDVYIDRIGLPIIRAALEGKFDGRGPIARSVRLSTLEAIASSPLEFREAARFLAGDEAVVTQLELLLANASTRRDARQAFAALARVDMRSPNLALASQARILDLIRSSDGIAICPEDLRVIGERPLAYELVARKVFASAKMVLGDPEYCNTDTAVAAIKLVNRFRQSSVIEESEKRLMADSIATLIVSSRDSDVLVAGVRALRNYLFDGYGSDDLISAFELAYGTQLPKVQSAVLRELADLAESHPSPTMQTKALEARNTMSPGLGEGSTPGLTSDPDGLPSI